MSEGEIVNVKMPRIVDAQTFHQALSMFVEAAVMGGPVAVDVAAIKLFHVMAETIAFFPEKAMREQMTTMIVTRLASAIEDYKKKHDERAAKTHHPEPGRIILQ